jgi:hypothetical protein
VFDVKFEVAIIYFNNNSGSAIGYLDPVTQV